MLAGSVSDGGAASTTFTVTVAATNVQTGESRVFVTDSNGQYVAPDLNPGRYTVTFELTGFQTLKREEIELLSRLETAEACARYVAVF